MNTPYHARSAGNGAPAPGVGRPNRNKEILKRGRLVLFAVFVLLVGIQLALVWLLPVNAFKRTTVIAEMLISTVWIGALIGAVWKRHSWARGILVALLMASALIAAVFIPIALTDPWQAAPARRVVIALGIYVTGQLGTALVLLKSPQIRRMLSGY